MVKRIKQDDMAGALELDGIGRDDPRLTQWLEEHRSRNGGKIHVGLGGRGVRIVFSRQADLKYWQAHYGRPGSIGADHTAGPDEDRARERSSPARA